MITTTIRFGDLEIAEHDQFGFRPSTMCDVWEFFVASTVYGFFLCPSNATIWLLEVGLVFGEFRQDESKRPFWIPGHEIRGIRPIRLIPLRFQWFANPVERKVLVHSEFIAIREYSIWPQLEHISKPILKEVEIMYRVNYEEER